MKNVNLKNLIKLASVSALVLSVNLPSDLQATDEVEYRQRVSVSYTTIHRARSNEVTNGNIADNETQIEVPSHIYIFNQNNKKLRLRFSSGGYSSPWLEVERGWDGYVPIPHELQNVDRFIVTGRIGHKCKILRSISRNYNKYENSEIVFLRRLIGTKMNVR